MIELRDVRFSYPQSAEEGEEISPQEALQGVSFSVSEGEFLCVVGHNGSGKSTLAKLMNALFLPTSGTVSVLGMDTKEEKNTVAVRRSVGLVLQNPDNQIVTTVVEEDVAFGLENLGVPPAEIRQRVDEALTVVGLSDRARSAPHMLSGGQKQRVAIAGILAMRPRVMVMDEPTAMLDPEGRAEVLSTVERLRAERGITVVWITHFMEEAMRADRVLVMDQGVIAAQGTPRELLKDASVLEKARLEAPFAVRLAGKLRARGAALGNDIMTPEELVEGLCALRQKS